MQSRTYAYDGLGRVKLVKRQDTNQVQIAYAVNATKTIDEMSHARIFEHDGLGRLKTVCEVTAGTTQSAKENCGISGFSTAEGYKTQNTYNERDDLTGISTGGQTRSFTFDNLSRLTAATIPEVNMSTSVSYEYDNDSNRTSVTDPRGKVCLEYDSLHRVTKKRHGTLSQACSAATVKAEFVYDGSASNNAIGRLVTEWDGTASSSDKTDYTYDPVGRILSMTRTISSTQYAMSYDYDLMGNLLHLSYPSSSGTRRKVEYAYNSNAEATSVKNIVDNDQSNEYNYVSNVHYSNLGPLSQMDFGSPANPVRTTIGWTKRALIDSILTQVTNGGATYLNLGYVYNAEGKIQQVKFNNDVNDLKTEKYTYDDLDRLLTAQRGPDTNMQRKYNYEYDRFGNRWKQDWVQGAYGYDKELGFDTINKNNRLLETGYSYTEGSVTAGNLTANGSGTSYTYNQENFMTAASSTLGSPTYAVDAEGRRVKKTVGGTTTDYFYVGAGLISEKTGSTWKDHIFFAGQRIAEQTGSTAASAVYLHTDHLGSTRRCTNADGSSAGTCDYEPFGENQPGTSCSVPTRFRFAGMDFDSNTALYHTWFREYDPNQGRWMSVDPLPGSEDDPQSRDRYAYVRNDPINFADSLGLHPCPAGTMHANLVNDDGTPGAHFCLTPTPTVREGGSINGGGGDLYAILEGRLDGSQGDETAGGTPQQPQPPPPTPPPPKEPSRFTTCAKAYYGFDTAVGVVHDGARVAVVATGTPIPKALLGLPRAGGGSFFTTLPSWLSLGQGTIASGNWVRAAGRAAVPIFVATAVIDAAAITTCTLID